MTRSARKSEARRWFLQARHDLGSSWNIDGEFSIRRASFVSKAEKALKSLSTPWQTTNRLLTTDCRNGSSGQKQVPPVGDLEAAVELDLHYVPSRYRTGS
jgi:hypothetical protein